jgi:hypothetical protein
MDLLQDFGCHNLICFFVFCLLSVLLHHGALLCLNYIFFFLETELHTRIPFGCASNSDHLAPNSFAWVVDYDKDDSHCTSALSPPMLGPYKPRPTLKVSERII